jgi:hypothetical protein
MTKDDLEKLQEAANDILNGVEAAIRELTKDNPLQLFTNEEADENSDDIYDYPYGYTVSKHGYYLQGAVQKVCDNDVTLFLTGEDWGEEYVVGVGELPVGSQIDLLTYLIERL